MMKVQFKGVVLVFAVGISVGHADDGTEGLAKSYVASFPDRVFTLSECNLTTLKCGRAALKVTTESSDDRHGEMRVYRTVSADGLEIQYSFPKRMPSDYRVGSLTVASPNTKMPLGLVIGDMIEKVERLLGPGKWFLGSLYYVNKEQQSNLQLVAEEGRVTSVRWEVYED